MTAPFDRSVFINCPFDDDFAPILQAMAFCVVYLGFHPRLAGENSDNSTARLDRIVGLIEGSKYGIHDLTRCKAEAAGEYARMNMPFELGVDFACRRFSQAPRSEKSILVLEHAQRDYMRALSDISGWDIRFHGGDFQKAVRHVRSWLIAQADAPQVGSALIEGAYVDFQQWYWEKQLAAGSSEADIREYPTGELVRAMLEWKAAQG